MALKEAARQAGIVKHVGVHTLRHGFATHLLLNGTDPRVIQEYLGHKSVETTMICTHVIRDLKHPAAESPLDRLSRPDARAGEAPAGALAHLRRLLRGLCGLCGESYPCSSHPASDGGILRFIERMFDFWNEPMNRRDLSRRAFLRCGAAAGAGAFVAPWIADAAAVSGRGARPRPVVAVAHDTRVRVDDRIDRARYGEMLDRAVTAVTGADDPRDGWRTLFRPSETVGVKVNCLAGPRLSTPVEGVAALCDRLAAAGIARDRVLVFERSASELTRAGYEVDDGDGAEMRVTATDRLAGGGYEREPTEAGEVGSCLSRIVTRGCDALISFAVAKDHDLSGVSASLKNLFGVIHNPNKHHDNHCDPYIADVALLPPVRQRLRLGIVDATVAQCHGGPAWRPPFAWQPGRVYAATDLAALDRTIADLVEGERARRGLPSLAEADRPPTWLETAQARGVGVSDPALFDRKEV